MPVQHRAIGAFDYYFSAIAARLVEPTEGQTACAHLGEKGRREKIITTAATMATEMVAARDKIVQLPGSVPPEPEPEHK